MIELYVSLSLLGLGYYIKKMKKTENVIQKDDIHPNNKNNKNQNNMNNMNNQNNMNNKQYSLKDVNDLEKKQAIKVFNERNNEKLQQNKILNASSKEPPIKPIKNVKFEEPLKKMTHNNMVPFFKGTINTNIESKSPYLEKFTGTSDLFIEKNSKNALFDPIKENIYGSSYATDLYQDRIQKPIVMNNIVPVEPIRVGKGIGQGYNSLPTGGFHQLEARDYAMPKTVDELRAKTNPKLNYKGRIIDGQKTVKRGNVLPIHKNKPETFYNNSTDRYFTTTGNEIKPSTKPIIDMKQTERQDINAEYVGPSYFNIKDGTRPDELAPYEPMKKTLKPFQPANINLEYIGKGDCDDHGKNSIIIYDNERNLTTEKTYEGNVTSLVKAIVAPIVDILKVNKKEYMIENAREMGELQAPLKKQTVKPDDIARTTIKETLLQESSKLNLLGGAKKIKVYDPSDIARPTIKETLLQEAELLNLDTRRTQAIARNDDTAIPTLRETLPEVDTTLNLNSIRKGQIVKDPNDIAKTTIKETNIEADRDGNITLHPKGMVDTDVNFDIKDTHKQDLVDIEYIGNINRMQENDGYKVAPSDLRPTQKEDICDNEYFGIAQDNNKEVMSYEAIYNATMNELKEELEKGREPTQTSLKINASKKQLGTVTDIKQNVTFESQKNKSYINQPVYSKITSDSVTKDKQAYENTRFDQHLIKELSNIDNPFVIKLS